MFEGYSKSPISDIREAGSSVVRKEVVVDKRIEKSTTKTGKAVVIAEPNKDIGGSSGRRVRK